MCCARINVISLRLYFEERSLWGMTGLHAHRGMKRERQRRGYREVIRRDVPASTEQPQAGHVPLRRHSSHSHESNRW